jgi:hypothetical protein
VSKEPTTPAGPSRDGHKQQPITPRTGEGSGTALEAMLRKRKQVEGPEPPDGTPQPPSPT